MEISCKVFFFRNITCYWALVLHKTCRHNLRSTHSHTRSLKEMFTGRLESLTGICAALHWHNPLASVGLLSNHVASILGRMLISHAPRLIIHFCLGRLALKRSQSQRYDHNKHRERVCVYVCVCVCFCAQLSHFFLALFLWQIGYVKEKDVQMS